MRRAPPGEEGDDALARRVHLVLHHVGGARERHQVLAEHVRPAVVADGAEPRRHERRHPLEQRGLDERDAVPRPLRERDQLALGRLDELELDAVGGGELAARVEELEERLAVELADPLVVDRRERRLLRRRLLADAAEQPAGVAAWKRRAPILRSSSRNAASVGASKLPTQSSLGAQSKTPRNLRSPRWTNSGRRHCDWKQQSGSVLSHGVLAWPGSDLA